MENPESVIRAVIVEDDDDTHPRIADLVATAVGLDVVGRSVNAADALRTIADRQPDVVLIAIETAELDRSEMLEALRTIDRIRALRRGRFLRRFSARSVNKVYFIPVDHVDWIDAADNYVRLHAGGREHLVRGTISGILPRLDPEAFIRVNRGLIVSTASIVAIEAIAPATYRLTMRDGARLTTSRTYVNAIRELRKALAG